jgi:hypothetical protein
MGSSPVKAGEDFSSAAKWEPKNMSKFQQQEVTFFDDRGCGGVSVRGIYLETDSDGCVEGPADIEREIAPHGFVRVDRETAKRIMAERKAAAQDTKKK